MVAVTPPPSPPVMRELPLRLEPLQVGGDDAGNRLRLGEPKTGEGAAFGLGPLAHHRIGLQQAHLIVGQEIPNNK